VRRERRAQGAGIAPLGPHAGHQEDRSRHQLAEAGETLRARRARDRADHREPALPRVRRARRVGQGGDPLVQGGAARVEVLQVRGPRVRGRHEQEDTGTGRRGRRDQRVERVASEQRVRGDRVGAEARDRSERRRSRADQRLGVRGGRDGHVAALAVSDRQQAGIGGRRAHLGKRPPACGAEPLEAGELELDRYARRSRGIDRRSAVPHDRIRRPLDGIALTRVARHRRRPQCRGIGIEPEHDPAAPLLDERGEPVGEVLDRHDSANEGRRRHEDAQTAENGSRPADDAQTSENRAWQGRGGRRVLRTRVHR